MRLYDDLAGWWPLLSPPAEYAEEAPLYAAGPARAEYDRHALGLFPRAFWLRALEEAGFCAEAVPLRLPAYAPDEPREMFVGVRR